MDFNSNLRFESVAPNRLKPNKYNPNRMTDAQFTALERAIAKEGFCGVVLANQTRKGLVIVDGEHRWRAAKKLHLKEVPCLIGEFEEEKAKGLTIKLNQIHGYWQASELVSLLDTMSDSLTDYGFSEQEYIAELERAMDDISKSPCPDSLENKSNKSAHIYISFKLTQKQHRLLRKGLDTVALSLNKPTLSRTDALVAVVHEYLNVCNAR